MHTNLFHPREFASSFDMGKDLLRNDVMNDLKWLRVTEGIEGKVKIIYETETSHMKY